MKGRKLLVSLLTAVALIAVTAVPALAGTGETTITANLESITITAPTGRTEFVLTPTAENSLISSTGLVTSNVAYDVATKDKMEASKAAGDAGNMVDWEDTAEWTTANQLLNTVKVNTTHTAKVGAGLPHDLTADDFTIILNAAAATDDDLLIAVTILTDASDVALTTAGHWYKITITFTVTKTT